MLQLGKLLLYEAQNNKLQLYFGQESLQLHHTDTESFVLGVITKDIINDLYKLRVYLNWTIYLQITDCSMKTKKK